MKAARTNVTRTGKLVRGAEERKKHAEAAADMMGWLGGSPAKAERQVEMER